jgi:Skp family chaperone for outer membrane proteins
LDKDLEFRYAVAGYLGLSEILKRLDSLAKEQVNLRKEQIRFREEQTKIWNEIAKVWEEIKALKEEQVKFREEQMNLRKEQIRFGDELVRLREDFNRAYRQLDSRLSRVKRTLEKMMLDVEEEARIVVKYRLRDMGYDVDVNPLILPGMELNIYGVAGDMCIIGEASVRAAQNLIDEINHIERMRNSYPEKLKPKIVRVIYTSLAMPDLIERAEREGIWILKATGDIVKPKNL